MFGSKKSHDPRDPICGKTISKDGPLYRTEANGRPYFFCSPSCKSSFKRNLQAQSQAILQQRRLMVAAARKAAKSSNCDSCG